jgi:hypothetical protein
MEKFAYVTLIILVLGFYLQLRMYKSRFLLHPSIWFFIIWILSVTSFLIFIKLGFDYIVFYEDLLIELFKYISFTALSILFISLLSFKRINRRYVDWNPVFNEDLFKIISGTILIITIINFFVFAGSDIVANREQIMRQDESIALKGSSLSFIQILLNIVSGINRPMLILSGYFICKEFAQNNSKFYQLKIYYFFPFFTGVIETIAMGGRAGITTTLLYIVLGIVLALFGLNIYRAEIVKKLVKYGIVVFVLFSVFATTVNVIREGGTSKSATEARWKNYPWLKPFGGILQYLTDHYAGYQLRRVDSITPQLELGQISLSGFTMFKIPVFSQLAGTPISIQSIFDLYKPDVVKASHERETEEALWADTTATVYYLLYDDFGYGGTYIAIFVFVLISQLIFNNVFKSHKTSFLSILPFTLVYYLWFTTIFSHTIIGNWMSPYIYSFLIADVIGRIRINNSVLKRQN